MMLPAAATGDVLPPSSTAAAASTAAVSMATERRGEFQIPARDSGSGSHLIKKKHSSKFQLKVLEASGFEGIVVEPEPEQYIFD
jgi:hypothetical protein